MKEKRMLMKRNSTLFYSYNSLNGSSIMDEQDRSKQQEIAKEEKALDKVLDSVTVHVPEHVCKSILDYAYAVCK